MLLASAPTASPAIVVVIIDQGGNSFLVGIDRRGQLAWRGECDSAGLPVVYIDHYRRCWSSIAEHDLTVSSQLVHRAWYRRQFRLILTEDRSLVVDNCQSSANYRQAWISALAAIAYCQQLGKDLDNKLLAAFLVETILSRQHLDNEEELIEAWSQWLQDLKGC